MTLDDLHLHEEVMLLALRDREGTVPATTSYPQAIGGAVLAELLLSRRLRIVREKKRELAEAVDREPLGDALLDEWLRKIAESSKRRTLQDWVGRIAGTGDLKHRVAMQLCRRGILRATEDEVLWIFTRKIYPELDPGPERRIVARIEEAIFGDGEIDPRTAVLVAVASHAGLLDAIFGRKRLKALKERIGRISAGASTGQATKEAIEAMEAAVVAAAMVPLMVSTVSTAGS